MTEDPASRRPGLPGAGSSDDESRFFAAYDAVLGRWPLPVDCVDVSSAYGTTHVHVCGPPGAEPIVLLHGGGATSTVWFANVDALSRTARIYALDTLNDVGRSVQHGRPVRRLKDLMGWLDETLTSLGLDRVRLVGHSYGGWMALSYAVHAPQRVSGLVLLDPTSCFAGMKVRYRLRALPLFVRPSEARMRAFLRWETGGMPLDETWLTLMTRGAAPSLRRKVVLPRRPKAAQLGALTAPTLLMLAENSKVHDVGRVSANAPRLLPHVRTAVLPGATHHSIPTEGAAALNSTMVGFFS